MSECFKLSVNLCKSHFSILLFVAVFWAHVWTALPKIQNQQWHRKSDYILWHCALLWKWEQLSFTFICVSCWIIIINRQRVEWNIRMCWHKLHWAFVIWSWNCLFACYYRTMFYKYVYVKEEEGLAHHIQCVHIFWISNDTFEREFLFQFFVFFKEKYQIA